MTNRGEPLARWLTPDTSDARIERVWAGIAEAEERPRTLGLWRFGAAGAVAAVAVIAFLAWPRTPMMQLGSPVVAEEVQREAKLSDGSQVSVARASKLELIMESPAEMRVMLPSGSATFEVSKRPSRKFIVQAGAVEVRVVGTRFTVQHDGDEVRVSVERGIVEVAAPDSTARLTAGQSWASAAGLPPPEAEHAEHAEHAAAPEPVEVPEPAESEAAPSRPQHAPAAHHPSRHHAVGSGQAGSGVDRIEAPPPQVPDGKTAEALFREALAARREGQFAGAVVAFEQILRDHPGDSRAPLAAYELGRLRMDEMSDLRGATQALELSLSLAPRAPFAEEALQRLVKAYDARGLPGPCAHARDDYLSRYPSGAYAEAVKGSCRH
jgi:transmembrane sensor